MRDLFLLLVDVLTSGLGRLSKRTSEGVDYGTDWLGWKERPDESATA
jgi:hypothetical protein